MANPKLYTVQDKIYWSYAFLAMAHDAVDRGHKKFGTLNWPIRTRLFKDLKGGVRNIHSFFDDAKIRNNQICNYCGSVQDITIDHVFPKHVGGLDDEENLIAACKTCNSSKGKKDLLEWNDYRVKSLKSPFLPLMVIRRYLKLTFFYCKENNLMDLSIEEAALMELPFKIEFLPPDIPHPEKLILNVKSNNKDAR